MALGSSTGGAGGLVPGTFDFMQATDESREAGKEAGAEQRIRAIVAEDDPLARRIIKETLQRAGIVVIAEALDGVQAVELVLYYKPDIVLMDVVMPNLDGVAATRRIMEKRPDQVVIMLTRSVDDEIGVLGLRAGASGYLTKDLDIEALPRVLEAALHGEAAISRGMAMRLVEHLRRLPEGGRGMRPVRSSLTAREWEVLDLLSEEKTTEDIADALVLSLETVRSHVKSILRKLDVRSRQDAVLVARRLRGLEP